MNYFIIIFFFIKLIFVTSSTLTLTLTQEQEHLETIFSFIHFDPYILPNIFNISISSNIPQIDNEKKIIKNINCLTKSSKIQADDIAYHNCPFTHDTCNCSFIKNNCEFTQRIDKYCFFPIQAYAELLIKIDNHFLYGLQYLLQSQKHSKIFIDNSLTHFGIYQSNNVININLIKSNIKNKNKNKKLKDTIIEFNNKQYLFSTNAQITNKQCLYQNKKNKIFIYEI